MIKFIKRFIALRKKRKSQKTVMGTTLVINQETNPLDVDLVDDNISKKDKKKLRQFTKVVVSFFMICASLWITWSYVLASISVVQYGNSQPLENLSKQICVTIVGVIVSYTIKSYLETYSSEKNKLELEKMNIETQTLDNDYTYSDGEALG